MKEQATEIKQGVIVTNNNLLFHFSGHNNDLLVLKQWKGAFNRIMPSLFSPLPQPRSQGSLLSALRSAGRREPWERGCLCRCFVRRPRAQALSCIYCIASLHNVLLTFFTVFFKICKII